MPKSWRPAAACSPAFALRVAAGLLLWLFISRTPADPDLWGHLRFGLDMLAAGTARLADTYSFTSDRAWINHEWLAEVLMALSYRTLGPWGLTLLRLATIAVVAWVVWLAARDDGASQATRHILVGLAVLATCTRTMMVRPQMFSIALVCVLLYTLRRAAPGRARALWIVPFLFVAWVNLHGGWIVGIAVLGAWTAAALIESRPVTEKLTLAGVGAASLAATLVNPYGVRMWEFLAATVGPERADIADWKPLLSLSLIVLVVESVLPALVLLSAAHRDERSPISVPVRQWIVVGLLAAATLRIGRIDAFLQASIAIFLTPFVARGAAAIGAKLKAPFWGVPRVPQASVAAAVIAAGALGASRLGTIAVLGDWIPDRGAAQHLRMNAPGVRLLTWYNWGEYAIWQLAPVGIRVSMDGRRETVYSDQVVSDHYAFYDGKPGTLDYPDRIGADVIWIPAEFPVVPKLRAHGWRVAYESPRSVVLRRDPPSMRQVAQVQDEPRAFPWP
jgi:hypothetical protein